MVTAGQCFVRSPFENYPRLISEKVISVIEKSVLFFNLNMNIVPTYFNEKDQVY